MQWDVFATDKITRIGKGQAGADILSRGLVQSAKLCGRIMLIDSKNRKGWRRTKSVTKLRADQTAAKAEHAILSTTVFPSGQKELFVESGMIMASVRLGSRSIIESCYERR